MLTWLGHRERRIVAGLCLLGALRVFVYSAAFPPFHSTDEPFHFDLIVKYAAGHVPVRLLEARTLEQRQLRSDGAARLLCAGRRLVSPRGCPRTHRRPAVLLDAISQLAARRGPRGDRRALRARRLPRQSRPRARGPAARGGLSSGQLLRDDE